MDALAHVLDHVLVLGGPADVVNLGLEDPVGHDEGGEELLLRGTSYELALLVPGDPFLSWELALSCTRPDSPSTSSILALALSRPSL